MAEVATGHDPVEAKAHAFSPTLRRAVAGVFLLCLVVSLAVVGLVEDARRQQAEQQARQLAAAAAHDFGTQLDRALSASYALATLVRQGRGRVDNFEALASEMLSVYGGISALQLAPGGTISQVVPLAGNESVIGFSPVNDPAQGPETRRVIESRKLGLVGPIILRQGGYGVVGRNPIFLPGEGGEAKFWGLTQVLVRIPDLLAATRIDQLAANGYAYEIWHVRPEDGVRQVFASSGDSALRDAVHESIVVPGGTWSISVAPLVHWLSYVYWGLEICAALLVSVLVSLSIYLLLRQPMLLRLQVAERTAKLEESSRNYRLMFERNPQPMFSYDRESLRLLDANEAFLQAYGYTAEEVRALRLEDLYPEEDRERLRAFVPTVSGRGLLQAGGWRHRCKDGRCVDVEVTSHDVTDRGVEARLVMPIDVTERRRAELRLQQQNTWLRSILEHFPDGITVIDGEKRIVSHNARMRELLAVPDEMLNGEPRKLIDFLRFNAERGEYGEVDVDAYVAEAEKRINLNVPHHFERTRPNGIVLDVRGSPLPDGGMVTSYSDITERKRTEALLQQQNEWLHSILEHFPDGITVVDRDTRVVAHNARFRELLDFPESMLTGEPPRLIEFLRYNALRGEYGDVDVETYVAEAEKRITLNVPHHFERTRPNGIVLDVRGSPLPDGGMVTSYSDVTERKATEEALRALNQSYERLNAELEARVAERTRELAGEVEERRAAEQGAREASGRLREIIETLSAGIVVWDGAQRLTAWNAAFETMFPQAAPMLAEGMNRESLRRALESQGAFPLHSEESGKWDNLGRWDRHLPDGRTILVERLATSDGGRLVLHQDVTRDRQTQEVLARNERMASLGNLVAGIAHEINTPIGNALMVSSSVAHRIEEFEADLASGPLRRSSLDRLLKALRESDDMLQRNLRRAAGLIQNFKQVAVDQTSDQRREFDLATVLEEIRMTLTPRLRQSTHRFEVDSEVGVRMDSYPGAVGQIVTNLVENALVHAFEGRTGGVLELCARRLDEHRVELLFRDDGGGIPPEVLPRIFDPFFTTRMGRGGSGLGLSIVFNLVRELLGGEMSVDSAIGAGTTFRIVLPTTCPLHDSRR